MSPEDLEDKLDAAFATETGYVDAIELLKAFKAAGGTQQEAMSILSSLRFRSEDDPIREEEICCVMDIAGGWCQVGREIW